MDKGVKKRNLKKCLIRWGIMATVIMFFAFAAGLSEKSQIMDHLDYDITLNEDGSAKIVETWDVYANKTNTLFRNFVNSNKNGKIKNVKVKDLETGKDLKQIDQEMYHVTKDCFYALDIKGGSKFEIAWGIGMDNTSGKRLYQISYTVPNVVTDYKDCQEFYWMLLNKDNGIPVKKVTGTIKFPDSVKNKENLKVWGHGPLNGNIEIASNNTVKFTVDNLSEGRMLEVRTVNTDKMFEVSDSKIKKYNSLKQIIDEETKWANTSNEQTSNFKVAVIAIYAVIILINLFQTFKFYKFSKRKDDGIVHRDLKYFRDIPREGESTPPEAAYLYFFDKDKDVTLSHQADVVSATILNLALKGYISLRAEGEEVYVDILKEDEGLKEDEKAIYKILEGTKKQQKGAFEIGKINDYAKRHYNQYSEYINKMVNKSRENLYKLELVDKAQKKQYNKAKRAGGMYSFLRGVVEFVIIGFLIGLIPIFDRAFTVIFWIGFKQTFGVMCLILLPFVLTILLKLKMRSKTQTKIAILTQKGTEEYEEWKGLATYMKEYSLIEEREVPELALWEKYLVFATAFGIADKAIEQMKAKYPEIFVEEYWEDEKMNQYQILNFASHNYIYTNYTYSPLRSLNQSTTQAYKTSLTEIALHSSSSGSGGGGGFSGGGRRPVVAEAGMGGR